MFPEPFCFILVCTTTSSNILHSFFYILYLHIHKSGNPVTECVLTESIKLAHKIRTEKLHLNHHSTKKIRSAITYNMARMNNKINERTKNITNIKKFN